MHSVPSTASTPTAAPAAQAGATPWEAKAALAVVLLLCALLSLAPYWAGYHRVWGDDDSWVHLKKVEGLLSQGPVGVMRVLYVRELSAHDHWRHPGMPPLMHILAVEGSYLVGLEWSVRMVPILVLVLATWWLYRLARTWGLAPADAVTAAALSGLSIEMIRQEGMRFLPQGLGVLLGIALIRSAYQLARSAGPTPAKFLATVVITALIPIGYGPMLFHIGGVIGVALLAEWRFSQRRLRSLLPVPAAMGAGFLLAMPFTLRVSYRPAHLYEYFVPISDGGRLAAFGDVIKYPVLIGPVVIVLALAGMPRILAGCRQRQPWAIWLASWLLFLGPQTLIWVFAVPGPPFRLLVLLIPGLAIAGAIGLSEIAARLRTNGGWLRVSAVAATALITVLFLAKVEIPRRRISDGEIAMYERAAALGPAATVYVTSSHLAWYFLRDRVAVRDTSGLAVGGQCEPGTFWLISDREWTGDSRLHPAYEAVARNGRTIFDQQGSRIIEVDRAAPLF